MSNFVRMKVVAFELDVTLKTVRNWASSGKIPPIEHPIAGNSRCAGYSEETLNQIKESLITQSKQSSLSS